MSSRLTWTSVVLCALTLAGCAVSPPMVETVPSPTPGRCEAAFADLDGATATDRDALIAATLEACSLDAWHLRNAMGQPDLPVERSADPQEQLATLCADERWASTTVCAQAAEGDQS